MSMDVGGGEGGYVADINVTPMVDVMLVLLIIFMVITPMLQKGKAVQLPTVPTPEKQGDTGKDIV
ncbi:MAG TPA: biopolymer transporter ExbD, partial [Blastocatellia bacterium]|nr:biopolymer transporter ExbD [Blastocatellia bacterium]